jgi:K+-sensing histidine kinase KdpD
MITTQSQHLTRLLDDLLDVLRIARGRIVPRSEPLEIREIIEPAIGSLTPAKPIRAPRGRNAVRVSEALRGNSATQT